jgi:hypothetical protein
VTVAWLRVATLRRGLTTLPFTAGSGWELLDANGGKADTVVCCVWRVSLVWWAVPQCGVRAGPSADNTV